MTLSAAGVAERVAVGDGCQSCAAEQSRAEQGRGRKCVKDPRYLARFLSYPRLGRLFLITPSLSFLLQVSEVALCIQFGAGLSNVERTNGLERV